jgi:hypothetical protein
LNILFYFAAEGEDSALGEKLHDVEFIILDEASNVQGRNEHFELEEHFVCASFDNHLPSSSKTMLCSSSHRTE